MQPDSCTEEYLLPQVDALLAGTLALMTGLSQSAGGCQHREVMEAKVCANLRELAGHPDVSASLRQVLARLLEIWSPAPAVRPTDQDRLACAVRPALLH